MYKISLGVMALFYVVAGINHFLHPEMYASIMPRFLPESSYRPLVAITGIFEAVLGLMLIPPATRTIAAWGIVILLIVIFPANIQMTIDFSRRHNAYTWLTWLRLPVQALLIWWAFKFTR
jgi:uncharacterized membrane protein